MPASKGGALVADHELHEIVLVCVGLDDLAEGARVLGLEPDGVLEAEGVARSDDVALLGGDDVERGEGLGAGHHVLGNGDVDGKVAGVRGVVELDGPVLAVVVVEAPKVVVEDVVGEVGADVGGAEVLGLVAVKKDLCGGVIDTGKNGGTNLPLACCLTALAIINKERSYYFKKLKKSIPLF